MEIVVKFGLIFAEYFAMWFGAIFGILMACVMAGCICGHLKKEKPSYYDTCDGETKERIAEILAKVKAEKEKSIPSVSVKNGSQKIIFDLPNKD